MSDNNKRCNKLLETVLLHVEYVGDFCLLPGISPDKIRWSVMTVLA